MCVWQPGKPATQKINTTENGKLTFELETERKEVVVGAKCVKREKKWVKGND